MGFLLSERGIEANLEKCTTIINMKSPTNVKEVQHLMGRMVVGFPIHKQGERYPYFACLRKYERF